MVWTALLGSWWQPWKQYLLRGKVSEVDIGIGGSDRNIGGEEMTIRVEAICLEVGYVRINHRDGEKLLPTLEGLHAQSDWFLAQIRFNKVSWRYLLTAKRHTDIKDGVAIGYDIWDNAQLGDALDLDLPAVLSPFAFGKESIDGFVHVTWEC